MHCSFDLIRVFTFKPGTGQVRLILHLDFWGGGAESEWKCRKHCPRWPCHNPAAAAVAATAAAAEVKGEAIKRCE